MATTSEFQLYSFLWIIVCSLCFFIFRRNREYASGLILMFLVFYLGDYGLQGFLHAIPLERAQITSVDSTEIILLGFRHSTIALVSFFIGAVFVSPMTRTIVQGITLRNITAKLDDEYKGYLHEKVDPTSLSFVYVFIGILVYFVISPLFRSVPTLNTAIGALYNFLPIGLIIGLSNRATSVRSKILVFLYIILIVAWPMISVIRDGFLGFGLTPVLIVGIFFVTRSRNLLFTILFSSLMGYIVFSLAISYFSNRANIRNVVWSNSGLDQNIQAFNDQIIGDFKLFNILDVNQLRLIDGRLTLNYYTGLSIIRIESGNVELVYGQSFADALVAIVPRALWPEKPTIAGGSDRISYFTGLYFAGGSSFAIGIVMEMYVNFGLTGTIIGFLILGILLELLSDLAENALRYQRYSLFSLIMISGLSFTLVGNDFSFILANSISSLITVWFVNSVFIALKNKL